MKEITKEKMLIPIKSNVFYKIRCFLRNLFSRKDREAVDEVRNIDSEWLKLQKRYNKGEIKEEDLTEEQMDALCELYDKQIENLLKSNAYRKQRIMAYWKDEQGKEVEKNTPNI